VVGWLQRAPNDRLCAPALAVLALNLCVGVLFVVRRRALATAPPLALLGALPSFLLAGATWALAPPPSAWPVPLALLFGAGAVFTLAAFLALGRSFAVLPGRRQVVVGGPYRWLRHPAYLGEVAMVAAAALAGVLASAGVRCLAPLVLGALALPAVALRVRVEEQVLSADPAYGAYSRQVRWRLLPGVW